MNKYKRKEQRFSIALAAGLLIGALTQLFAISPEDADTTRANDSQSIFFGDINIISTNLQMESRLDHLKMQYARKRVNPETIEEFTTQILALPISKGYYFPGLSLREISPCAESGGTKLNPTWQLDWGDPVQVDTFLYKGLENTLPRLLDRELLPYKGKMYNPQLVARLRNSVARYPFLMLENEGEIVKTVQGATGLLLTLKEARNNRLGGVLGYVPPSGVREGYFTGEIDLELLNLSGTGRQLSVYWSKVNRYSQSLKLGFFEPWIWKTRLFGNCAFQQDLRDTLAVIRDFQIGVGKRAFGRSSVQLQLGFNSTLPTPGGKEILGLSQTRSGSIGMQFGFDNRNRPLNPTTGTFLKLAGTIGQRTEEVAGQVWQFQGGIDAETFYAFLSEWVAAGSVHFKGKWFSRGRPDYAEQYWFGGARSLRGYANDFFRGSEVGWLALELRWIIGDYSRIYAFTDQGYYKLPKLGVNETGFPNSIGIGLRLESRMGIIGLDYGFGKGDTFTTAKIHLYLENRF